MQLSISSTRLNGRRARQKRSGMLFALLLGNPGRYPANLEALSFWIAASATDPGVSNLSKEEEI